ncbi:MAG: hypothetical protein K1X28_01720 [Parachlamydiales bacterium]|nr:hypothetical protein [Parachlamydiales bacterium]
MIATSNDSKISIELVSPTESASQPLITSNRSRRGWGGCFEATVATVSAISGLATAVSGILSKAEPYNRNHETNAKYCGIVWAVSVGAGALLSLKTGSFKPVALAIGGPITGAIGVCCLICHYFTNPGY